MPGEGRYYLFYNGSSVRHDRFDDAEPGLFPVHNIGVAFLRKDGFVSASSGLRHALCALTRPTSY